jgi:hypothetical protein
MGALVQQRVSLADGKLLICLPRYCLLNLQLAERDQLSSGIWYSNSATDSMAKWC